MWIDQLEQLDQLGKLGKLDQLDPFDNTYFNKKVLEKFYFAILRPNKTPHLAPLFQTRNSNLNHREN